MSPADQDAIYRRQARWFAPERSRLLRRVNIGASERVLDLGAGTGVVLGELARRTRGVAIGIDQDNDALRLATGLRALARATELPFPAATFDVIFTQMFFLWARPLEDVVQEIARVLADDGHLIIAAEPDYGGAIAHPVSADVAGELARRLTEEGADPHIGRKLGPILRKSGFRVTSGIHPARPLEAARADSIFAAPELYETPGELEFLFIPYFCFLATRADT